MQCTFCQFNNKENSNIFCTNCGKIIRINDSNFFSVFELPVSFDVKVIDLNQKLVEFLSKMHPDKFVNCSNEEKAISMENSQKLNNIFKVLKDPLLRAKYILSLNGLDVESIKLNDMEFLEMTMEWRERSASIEEVQCMMDEMNLQLGRAFIEGKHNDAAQMVLKLNFLKRYINEVQ